MGNASIDAVEPGYHDKVILKRNAVGKLELSVTVRDKDGNFIAQIEKNHWTISPDKSASWDKNYTEDTLEVQDGKGRVVLQVRLTETAAEMQVEFNQVGDTEGGILVAGQSSARDGIKPIFKYPSALHWGAYLDKRCAQLGRFC